MTARLTTLLIWAAALAGAVAWGLPLFTRATPVPASASLAQPAPPAGGGLVRLLGQPPAAPVAQAPVVAVDSRFQLLGVVAPRQGATHGLALIAVDGKPARALAVGREIEPGLRVLTVGHRQVQLGAAAGAPSVTLSLPPLPEAQRGRPGDVATAPPAQAAMPGVPGMAGQAPMVVPPMNAGVNPAMLPQAAFPGAKYAPAPGMARSPAQAVPAQPQQLDAVPASLPYQPDGGAQPADGQANQPGSLPTR